MTGRMASGACPPTGLFFVPLGNQLQASRLLRGRSMPRPAASGELHQLRTSQLPASGIDLVALAVAKTHANSSRL